MAIGVQTDMATPALARYGSDELRKEFLAPSIAGDYVACLGVSEVGAGSDVASLKTTAKRAGGDWVINGGKMWTTNGTQADWMCLLANTGEGPVHKNKSLIVVPMKTKGVQVVKKLDKLGMRSSDTAQIFFDEVKVPVRHTIGQEGMGFVYQMQQFQEERLWGAISAVVGMERLIDQTVEYTRERKVFGRPLLDNQVIHFKLAEFRTEVELVRSLCYRACEEYLDGTDVTMLASMAKLKAGRMLGWSPTAACNTGAVPATSGNRRPPARSAIRGWPRSAAAPTRSCCRSFPSSWVRCRVWRTADAPPVIPTAAGLWPGSSSLGMTRVARGPARGAKCLNSRPSTRPCCCAASARACTSRSTGRRSRTR